MNLESEDERIIRLYLVREGVSIIPFSRKKDYKDLEKALGLAPVRIFSKSSDPETGRYVLSIADLPMQVDEGGGIQYNPLTETLVLAGPLGAEVKDSSVLPLLSSYKIIEKEEPKPKKKRKIID